MCRHLMASMAAPTQGAVRFAEWAVKSLPSHYRLRSTAERSLRIMQAHFKRERNRDTLLRPSTQQDDNLLRPSASAISEDDSLLRLVEVYDTLPEEDDEACAS
jgi:hypothetical protein